MPIRIDKRSEKENEEVAWLCNEEWELPTQTETLESWLKEEGSKLEKGSYVADIGFSPRPGASGGGGAISVESMQIMASIGMELFLSEYPEFVEELPPNE